MKIKLVTYVESLEKCAIFGSDWYTDTTISRPISAICSMHTMHFFFFLRDIPG